MISVTTKAAKKALWLAKHDDKPPVLRVGVKGGGCSGLTYFIDFVDAPKDNDNIMEVDGLTVVVDPKSLNFIDDTVLDFDTNLLSGGFKFTNPRAKRSCSCGESFTV